MIARSSRNIRFFLEGTSMLFFLLIFMFCLLFFYPFFTTFLSLSLSLSICRASFFSIVRIYFSFLLTLRISPSLSLILSYSWYKLGSRKGGVKEKRIRIEFDFFFFFLCFSFSFPFSLSLSLSFKVDEDYYRISI